MKMNEIETFVRLKYEILTPNSDTWERCEATYPASVKSKWAWRCATDVEHLAEGYPEAEKCIAVAKLYRDGKATMKELKKAWNKVLDSDAFGGDASSYAAYYASVATYRAAAVHAGDASDAGSYAAYRAAAAHDHAAAISNREEKWKLYIEWLIEELCEYEQAQGINI